MTLKQFRNYVLYLFYLLCQFLCLSLCCRLNPGPLVYARQVSALYHCPITQPLTIYDMNNFITLIA